MKSVKLPSSTSLGISILFLKNLLIARDDWTEAQDNGLFFDETFIGFSKAFYKVSHYGFMQ